MCDGIAAFMIKGCGVQLRRCKRDHLLRIKEDKLTQLQLAIVGFFAAVYGGEAELFVKTAAETINQTISVPFDNREYDLYLRCPYDRL